MGMSAERPLPSGAFHGTTQTATHLLSYLAEWVNKPGERHLARRILAKAAELADSENASVLDRHFLQQHILQANYPDRDDPEAIAAAIRACEDQIALAEQAATAFRAEYPGQPLPQHVGYKQLTIIHDKQGCYDAAIALCKQARAQGWNGNWDHPHRPTGEEGRQEGCQVTGAEPARHGAAAAAAWRHRRKLCGLRRAGCRVPRRRHQLRLAAWRGSPRVRPLGCTLDLQLPQQEPSCVRAFNRRESRKGDDGLSSTRVGTRAVSNARRGSVSSDGHMTA